MTRLRDLPRPCRLAVVALRARVLEARRDLAGLRIQAGDNDPATWAAEARLEEARACLAVVRTTMAAPPPARPERQTPAWQTAATARYDAMSVDERIASNARREKARALLHAYRYGRKGAGTDMLPGGVRIVSFDPYHIDMPAFDADAEWTVPPEGMSVEDAARRILRDTRAAGARSGSPRLKPMCLNLQGWGGDDVLLVQVVPD
jgi:hypothetical protein